MKKYRKGVFIVVYYIKKNKPLYLILKRKLHWKGYEFSKGGVKFLETKRHAVKRELFEESELKSLKIKNHKIKGKYPYEKKLVDRKGIYGQTFSLFSAKVNKLKVKIDKKEHSNYEWLNFERAFKKLTYKDQKDCLKIVNDFLNKSLK